LRKKLSAAAPDADFIKTVRNRGYQFSAPVSG
jgi:DNA-binding winged helix-turn-helix (wHTH) protein